MKRFAAYRDHQVFNAPNEQLVVMLFETAIHRLQRAKDGMVSGHSGARVQWCEDLGRVRAIYIEMMNALDPTVAPELTRSLALTYSWVIGRLSDVGRGGNPDDVEGILRVTNTLLDAFRQANDAQSAEAQASAEQEVVAEAG